MSGIIKRRHTNQYAQIHNSPLQGGLKDLRAVGVLAHLMSLPENWEIHKTQVQAQYSRRNVDAGFKELAEKKYLIGFSGYFGGKKNYFYCVSDQPFTEKEYEEYLLESIKDIESQGKTVKSIKPLDNSPFTIPASAAQYVHQSTDAQSVQHTRYTTERAYINKIQTNKQEQTNINNTNNEKNERPGPQLFADIPELIKKSLLLLQDNNQGNDVWKKIIDSYVHSDLFRKLNDGPEPAPKLQKLLNQFDWIRRDINNHLYNALKGSSRGSIDELKGYLYIVCRDYFNGIAEAGSVPTVYED